MRPEDFFPKPEVQQRRLTWFLRSLAGGTRNLDRPEVSSRTRNIYTRQGAAVLLTALVSGFGVYVATTNLTEAVVLMILIPPFWFVLKALFDSIMSSKVDEAVQRYGRLRAFLVAIPSLFFAVVLSLMSTEFIMTAIMKKEIDADLQGKHVAARTVLERELGTTRSTHSSELAQARAKAAADTDKVNGQANPQIAQLQSEANKLQSEFTAAQRDVAAEVDGRAASGQVGVGSRSKLKQANADRVKSLLDAKLAELAAERARIYPMVAASIASINATLDSEVARLNSQLKDTEVRLEQKIAEHNTISRGGFIDRHQALMRLWRNEPLGMSFLALVLFIIEAMPVLLKLISGKTDYHRLMQTLDDVHETEQSRQRLESETKRRQHEKENFDAEMAHRKAVRSALIQDQKEEDLAKREHWDSVETHLNKMEVGQEAIQDAKVSYLSTWLGRKRK